MKVKVIIGFYPMESGFKLLRAYKEIDYEQAEKDLEMIVEADTGGRNWNLIEIELFN